LAKPAEDRSYLSALRGVAAMFIRSGWGRSSIISSAMSTINGLLEARAIEPSCRTEEALPLYFLHIAKTGGTSLTAALKAFYRAEDVITNAGNISVEFIKAQEHRLHTGVFVHGHAQHGVMSHVMSSVRAITLLRDPPDQAVSNYLHVARDLDNPLRCAAINLGFSRFLTTFWQYAVYQVNALDVSITPQPAPFAEDLEQRVGRVFALLDQMFFVGCLEQLNEVSPLLSLMLGLPACLTVPRLNTAAEHGTDAETIQRLRAEYEALQDNVRIAHLLSLERSIYNKAASLRGRYERWCVEQAFLARTSCPASFYTGYTGPNGIVYLAGNWRPPEMTAAGPGWWTDSDERSTLVIEMAPAVYTLEAEIYVTHFVNKLVFEADGLVLDHSFETTEDSNQIRVDLRPISRQQNKRAILTLRLAREVGPSVPPHYPALALRSFQLV
jgi:hypothetical protein